jgi:hypothetical protein
MQCYAGKMDLRLKCILALFVLEGLIRYGSQIERKGSVLRCHLQRHKLCYARFRSILPAILPIPTALCQFAAHAPILRTPTRTDPSRVHQQSHSGDSLPLYSGPKRARTNNVGNQFNSFGCQWILKRSRGNPTGTRTVFVSPASLSARDVATSSHAKIICPVLWNHWVRRKFLLNLWVCGSYRQNIEPFGDRPTTRCSPDQGFPVARRESSSPYCQVLAVATGWGWYKRGIRCPATGILVAGLRLLRPFGFRLGIARWPRD